MLHIKKTRDESQVSEQKTDLSEEPRDIEERLIGSTLVNLAQIIESYRNLLNDEINARQFQGQNPETHLRVVKMKIINGTLTMIVSSKKVQELAKGMKLDILRTDDNGLERDLGTARISFVQSNGRFYHACAICYKGEQVWQAYMKKCDEAGECIPHRMSLYVKSEEELSDFSLMELKGAKKLLQMMLLIYA